jgi:hypothetical protein
MTIHGATLNGVVNPMGSDTTVSFEYGLTIEYGTVLTLPDILIGHVDIPVSIDITSLNPVTEYHFRVKAINDDGEAIGEDMVFTTLVDQENDVPVVVTMPATNIT